jgi:hypothetical protein
MAKAKRGGNPRTVPDGKTQVNFNISDMMLDKVKVLALMRRVTNSEIYNRAIDTYIETYEKKHGKIKSVPKAVGVLP